MMTAIPLRRVRGEQHVAAFQPASLPKQGLIDYVGAAAAMEI